MTRERSYLYTLRYTKGTTPILSLDSEHFSLAVATQSAQALDEVEERKSYLSSY